MCYKMQNGLFGQSGNIFFTNFTPNGISKSCEIALFSGWYNLFSNIVIFLHLSVLTMTRLLYEIAKIVNTQIQCKGPFFSQFWQEVFLAICGNYLSPKQEKGEQKLFKCQTSWKHHFCREIRGSLLDLYSKRKSLKQPYHSIHQGRNQVLVLLHPQMCLLVHRLPNSQRTGWVQGISRTIVDPPSPPCHLSSVIKIWKENYHKCLLQMH